MAVRLYIERYRERRKIFGVRFVDLFGCVGVEAYKVHGH
jgi:hypothetical protein